VGNYASSEGDWVEWAIAATHFRSALHRKQHFMRTRFILFTFAAVYVILSTSKSFAKEVLNNE